MISYPRSNPDIALFLLNKFVPLIESISYRMGVKYRLSEEDRQDLISAARAKLMSIKWRTLLKRSGGKNLDNYAISVIQTIMVKELRRIKAEGLSGLTKGPTIGAFPLHADALQAERSLDVNPNRTPAMELTIRAKALLSPQEWGIVSLAYAFDGGPNRTPRQIARELDLSTAKVEVILENSMQKLRRSLR